MELTDDGALKTTTKKGNGVNIRVMKVIAIMSSLNLTLNYKKSIFLEKIPSFFRKKWPIYQPLGFEPMVQ